jgi:hypothetical protein
MEIYVNMMYTEGRAYEAESSVMRNYEKGVV